ncbi:MAG: hypothetical protein N2Z67_11975 [Acetobacteraceae bacterium]|nr:hypothetical protein [Acetobacteraceae bacterium]
MRRAAFGALLLLVHPALAEAPAEAPRIPVRTGDHPGHGRIVFDWPAIVPYQVIEGDGTVRLSFSAPGVPDLSRLGRPPRNVAAIAGSGGQVEIRLAEGARLRHYRLGTRIVLDISDPQAPPSGATPQRQAALPLPPPAPPERTVPLEAPARSAAPPPMRPQAEAPAAQPAAPEPEAARHGGVDSPGHPVPARDGTAAPASVPPQPASPSPPPSLTDPAATPVRILAPAGGARALALVLPEGTAAAAFRRGDWLFAVFDSERRLDLSALRGDAVFGHAEAVPHPGATVLRLPLAPPAVLVLSRQGTEWRIEPRREAPPARSVVIEADPGPPAQLALRAAAPGRVVPLTDPETGLPLLVATVAEPGQAMAAGRRLPQLDLLPTTLGAAALARDDRLRLVRGQDRFRLTAEGSPEGVRIGGAGAGALADAAAMTRLFDLPHASPADLQARAREQQAAVAAAPPLQRAPLRRALAQTLLALGLPQEAQAVLGLAMQEDPRAAADATTGALAAAAAALADRPEEAGALADPRLAPSDELALWQAVLAARRGDPAAGAGFAASLPLLLAYPDALRARLLPIAALALAEAGEAAALQRLLAAAPGGPVFDLARGRLAEAEGRISDALAAYDAAAAGRDRRARAQALRRGIELRLAQGLLDAAGAANALEAALFAWRGEAEELATRLRVAELRREAGAHRAAFDLLRETEALFPADAPRIRAAASEALVAALEREPPLAAVALHDANRALLAGQPREAEVALLLAERLIALDLPRRAEAVLRDALAAAEGAARGRVGLRLAEVRLSEGDAAGALAALGASDAAGLDAALRERRALLGAEALARSGARAEAIAALEALGPAGHAARARLLAEDGRWAEAADALAAHLSAAPAEGRLPEAFARDAVRLAAFAALAGQERRLAELRAGVAPRLPPGRLADAFAALAADPVRGTADLPRVARELEFLRDLPRLLEPLRADAAAAR